MSKREIKFRVWSKITKHMWYPKFALFESGCVYSKKEDYELLDEAMNGMSSLNEDNVIMQYTGLKDKNGKEIYEGDIMKVTPPIWAKEGIFKVIYDNGRFIITDNKVWQNIGTLVEYSEVIGNIYDNPELLEVK